MSSKIEDFAVELWFELLNYLSIHHQFTVFFDLNKNLNQILFSYHTRISLKDNEDAPYVFKYILPHRENITRLRLENTNKLNLIDPTNLLHFPRLITLIVHRLNITEDVLKIFQQNLTHLRYLSISSIVSGNKKSLHQLLEMILSTSNLQICRLRLGISMSPMELKISSKNSIKYLQLTGINEVCSTDRLISLLRYLPCLQSLHIIAGRLSFIPIVNTKTTVCTSSVMIFTLNIKDFIGSFVQFTDFIVTLTPHVQQLKIICRIAGQNLSYLNQKEWIMFVNSLPKLKKLVLNICRPGEIDEQLWNKSCQRLTKWMTKNHLDFQIDK